MNSIRGISPTTRFDPVRADAGMRLLSAKQRRLHPAAQVQTLRRIARRATVKADWFEELRDEHYRPMLAEAESKEQAESARTLIRECTEGVPPLREKARNAVEAMCRLNAEHGLGY